MVSETHTGMTCEDVKRQTWVSSVSRAGRALCVRTWGFLPAEYSLPPPELMPSAESRGLKVRNVRLCNRARGWFQELIDLTHFVGTFLLRLHFFRVIYISE